jgi:MYXO-CTERM domain-containing protein
MKTRAALVLSVLGAATSAFGQVQSSAVGVHWTLSWAEARVGASGTFRDGAVGNIAGGTVGQLDAGEGALLFIKMAMNAPPGGSLAVPAGDGTGTPLTWDPSIVAGSSGTGTLSGFWSGDLNLTGSQAGGWSDGSTNFAAALRRKLLTMIDGGGTGSPTPTGNGLTDIQPAQFGANAAALNHSNNLNVWQGLWIPGAGVNGVVNFNLAIGNLGLLSSVAAIDDGHSAVNGGATDLPIALNVATTFGTGVSFTVVPTPSSLALLGLGGLIAARRRR